MSLPLNFLFFDLSLIIIRVSQRLSITFMLVFLPAMWLTTAVRNLSNLGQERTSERPLGRLSEFNRSQTSKGSFLVN